MDTSVSEPVTFLDGRIVLYNADCRDMLPTLAKVDAVVTDPFWGIERSSGSTNTARGKANYKSPFEDTRESVRTIAVPAVIAALALANGRGIVTPGSPCAWLYPEPDVLGGFYQPASVGLNRWGRASLNPVLFYGRDPRSGKAILPTVIQVTEPPSCYDHPCAKPMKATEWMVERASLPNETVLDPFLGSGTCGVAAVKLGRRFIGIEIDEGYFKIACKRIEEATRQPDLFIERAPEPKQEAFL